ncbi:MAG: hypothetical protein K6C40_15895, partial [Thermoguttaceae bacterium]|nr:hypothetical protein [Thermoguttaceae bacterium]
RQYGVPGISGKKDFKNTRWSIQRTDSPDCPAPGKAEKPKPDDETPGFGFRDGEYAKLSFRGFGVNPR